MSRDQAHPDDRRTGVINAGMFSLEHLELIAYALRFQDRRLTSDPELIKLAQRFEELAKMLK